MMTNLTLVHSHAMVYVDCGFVPPLVDLRLFDSNFDIHNRGIAASARWGALDLTNS